MQKSLLVSQQYPYIGDRGVQGKLVIGSMLLLAGLLSTLQGLHYEQTYVRTSLPRAGKLMGKEDLRVLAKYARCEI